jgi:hypothetical protein
VRITVNMPCQSYSSGGMTSMAGMQAIKVVRMHIL